MIELIAIKKNDKYYVRHIKETYFRFEDFVFNAEQLPSFSENWRVFKELPTTMQKKHPARQRLVKYNLKDGFPVSEKTPATQPAGFFEYLGDGEYQNNDIRGLYLPEYEEVPELFEDVGFTIELIDTDCEPLVKPKYPFVSDFPYNIDNHEVVRHKYPCHIEAQTLFDIIRDFCKKNLPEHCKIESDYGFHFCIELVIPVLHEETRIVDVAKFGANKPKLKEVPLRSISFNVIDIQPPQRDRSRYGKDTIQAIPGANYAELEEKIDTLLRGYRMLMSQKLAVCSHCKGYGFNIAGQLPPFEKEGL